MREIIYGRGCKGIAATVYALGKAGLTQEQIDKLLREAEE